MTDPLAGDSESALYLPMGQRIRGVRESAGLTQQQLADALGVTQVTISQWENGHRAPRTPTAWITLAEGLNTDLDWIIRGQPKAGYAPGWNDALSQAEARVGDALRSLRRADA